MNNTRFFDMIGFREFLKGNFSGASLASCGKKVDRLFVEPCG
jgi:hypothetical protein